jgi:hypothetical protein
MHRLIAATALCAVALGATAEVAATSQVSAHARPTAMAMQAAATPAMRVDRVKTTGATTSASTTSDQTQASPDDHASRHTGPAMLFAALALMLGVALRRLGAGPR